MFRKSLALAFASVLLLVNPAAAQYGGGPGLPIPVPVSKGGTGATTAAGARTSLGVIGAGSSSACGTVTISTPCLDLSQTWNNVATSFTGLKFNVTDTASASGSLLMDLQVGGVSQLKATKTGEVTAVSRFIAPFYYVNNDTGAIFFGASLDTVIRRDGAANILALRNGTAAQAFNVYNTYTDASNYERGVFDWTTNAGSLTIGTSRLGTGVAKALQFYVSNSNIFQINTSGHTLWNTDNAYDIGANGANRPRNLFLGGAVSFAGNLNGSIASLFYPGGSTRGAFGSPSDGAFSFSNNAGTNLFTMTAGGAPGASGVQFGGTVYSLGSIWSASSAGLYVQGRSGFISPADGTFRITNNAGTITTDITLSGASSTGTSTATFGGGIKTTGATFALQTATTLTDNAAAQVATMTNGPTAGNPTKWIAINDNGTTRYIPAW